MNICVQCSAIALFLLLVLQLNQKFWPMTLLERLLPVPFFHSLSLCLRVYHSPTYSTQTLQTWQNGMARHPIFSITPALCNSVTWPAAPGPVLLAARPLLLDSPSLPLLFQSSGPSAATCSAVWLGVKEHDTNTCWTRASVFPVDPWHMPPCALMSTACFSCTS